MKNKNLFLIILITVLVVVASDQITKTIALRKAGLPLFSKKVPEGSKIIADGSYGEYIVKVGKISFHRTSVGSKLRLITLIAMPLVLVIYLRSGRRQDESKRNAFFRDLLFNLAWGLSFGALITNNVIDNIFRVGGVNWIWNSNLADIIAIIAFFLAIIFYSLFVLGIKNMWKIVGITILSCIVLGLLLIIPQFLSAWKTTTAIIERRILPYEYTPPRIVELRKKAEELKKLLPEDSMPWSITAFISGEVIEKIDRATATSIREEENQEVQYSGWQNCQAEYTQEAIQKMMTRLPQSWTKEIKTISFSSKTELANDSAKIIVYGDKSQGRLDAVLKSVLWGLSWLNSPWLDNRLSVGLRIDALWKFSKSEMFNRVEYKNWSVKQIWCEMFARYLLVVYPDLPASSKIIWINFSESDVLFCEWYIQQTN